MRSAHVFDAAACCFFDQAPTRPKHGLSQLEHSVQFVGRPVEAVEVSISLGAAAAASSSQNHFSVEVGGDQVRTTCINSNCYPYNKKGGLLPLARLGFNNKRALLQVFVSAPGHEQLLLTLPFGVDAGTASAHVADDGATLLLRMPFKPYRTCVEEASPPCP